MAKPLAISVGRVGDVEKWAKVSLSNQDLNALLPGPVTLVFDRKESLPDELNPNARSIGIRIPNSKFMIELAKFCDEPIALTSANFSNQLSSLKVEVSFFFAFFTLSLIFGSSFFFSKKNDYLSKSIYF